MKKSRRRPTRKAAPSRHARPASATRPASVPPASVPPTSVMDGPDVQERFQAAFAAHRGGRLAEAEAGYRAVLRDAPGHPHALNNLAILLKSTRRFDEAQALYRQGLGAAPDSAAVRALAKEQLERLDKDRLACARLAGQDRHAWTKLHPGVLDECEIAGAELSEHQRPSKNSDATVS